MGATQVLEARPTDGEFLGRSIVAFDETAACVTLVTAALKRDA
jgi:hypothetical protein